nr:hypothetical protein [Tanacetum cinerariifolium]
MQSQASNTLHNAIMEAGSKDRPLMLAPGSPITRTEKFQETYKNVSQDIRDQLNVEAEAVQIILTGIDNDIYSTVDACPNACEMWKAIESSAKIKKHDDKTKSKAKGKSHVKLLIGYRNLSEEFEDFSDNSINEVNVASTLVPTIGQISTNSTNTFSTVALEDITYSDDEEDVGEEADITNLETIITITPIPTTRVHKDHHVTQIISDLYSSTQTRSMTRMVKDQGGLTQINNADFHACMFAWFLSQEEPKRVHQALKDPSWIEAMQEELLQFMMQKVWVLVDLPNEKRAIGTKWVFRNKKDERGIIVRNKARLVAQGHTHEEGINYEEVFAQVTRIEAIRLFLAYASFMGFMVYRMDVKSAFLYRTIEEEVYVCQPPGYEDLGYPNKFYKVVKALYELHQAPRAWSMLMTSFLALLIKTYGKLASTPIDTGKPLLKDPDGEDVDVHTYTSMIGSLMYLTSSRPDIMFAVYARIDCLPNEEILIELARMGYEKHSTKLTFYKAFFSVQWKFLIHTILQCMSAKRITWNEFSSSMASVVICLSTERIDCLPNEEILIELARMGYEKHSTKLTFYKAFFSVQWKFLIHTILQCMSAKRITWNEFSSSMASVVICLSTGRKFNFSKYNFDSLMRNVDSSSKFYMDVGEQQAADDIANIAADDVDDVVAEDVTEPTLPSPIPTTTPPPPQELPSTSQVAPTPRPSPIAQLSSPPQQQQPSQPTIISMDILHTLQETCIALTRRVKNLEQDKIAQALEITRGCIQTGRIIADIDADKDVTLEDVEDEKNAEFEKNADVQGRLEESQAKVYHIDLEHAGKVLRMSYDDIRPIFEKYFNSNVAFLEKGKEELEEEESRSLKRKTKSSEEKAAKKQKLDEEICKATTARRIQTRVEFGYILHKDQAGESLSIHITFSFTFNSQQEIDHKYPTIAKITVLDTEKFEQWQFRIQQYLQHEHYALWEVIEFEDSYVVPANTTTIDTTSGEKSGRTVTLTAEDMQRKKNDVKARTTLLLSLPDEHQLRFKGSETLKQTFTRLQVIVGQLQFMDVEIEQDDLNQKFFTSLAPEWLMHTIVWRNKSDLDTMSLDDLYNHLKVYESEVQKKSEPNSQNMAFISSAKHSSGNEDGNTVCVPTASTNVPTASASVATISQDTTCAYIASQSSDKFWKKTWKKISIQGSDVTGFDKSKVECFNCHKMGHFARECRAPRSQDRGRRDSYRQGSKAEEQAPKALMAIDERSNKNNEGLGYTVVPPPPAQLYLSPKTDLSWTGLPECADDTVTDYSRPSPTVKSISEDDQNRNPSVSENLASPITPKHFIKFVKPKDSQSKTDKKETPKKLRVKYAEQYRKPNKKPKVRGNQRNWNNLKSHQLGSDFVMKKKACFNCGDFNHLAYGCRKRVKKNSTPRPAHSYANRPVNRTSAVRSPYRASWVSTVNRKYPPVNRTFSTGSRNFPTANRKFPTASRKFPTCSTKSSTADMGRKRKAGSSQNKINDKGYWESGCSRHMTGNISYLSDYEPFDGGYVSFGQGGCKITGKGTIKTGKLEFKNVYFVKDLKYNMFSVSQICDNKNSVLFTDSECIVLRRDFKLLDDANILLRTPRQHNMYSIDFNNIVPHRDLTCLVAKTSADECMLWHRRLGHLNLKTMNELVRHNLVRGLPTKCFENDHTCTACLKGKQHKASCKSKLVNSVTKPLHTLHMALFSPTSVSSISHKWYCLVVTDDFSRFTWTFFLKSKDETSGIVKKFITEIENLKDLKVKIIRCDNGGEFRNKEMNDFCSQKEIKREFSNARTPLQNGVAERRNRTLIEAARTMLDDAKLPVTFWAEAVNTAGYIQNRVLVNKSHNKTPYELFNGKFEEKGDEGYFIGYSMSSKAFRVFNKRTRRVEENLHVELLENKAIEKGSGPNWLFDIDSLTKSINYVPVDAGTISTNLSGTKDAARQEVKKDVSSLRYIALPNWAHDALLEFSSSKPQDHCSTEVPEGSGNSNSTASTSNPPADQMETLTVETPIPTVSSPVPIAYSTDSQEPSSDTRLILKRVVNQEETPSLDNILSLTNQFKDILGGTTNSDESNGEEADISNMEIDITASPTPTLRIHKDHPKSQIIGHMDTPIQTRNNSKEVGEQFFVPVGKFTFPADFVVVDYESDPRVPLILGRPFLRTARALIDVYGEEMILRDGDERLTLNMKHDTTSYSNHPYRESINLINIFNLSNEDCLKDLVSHKQSGNPTFPLHKEIASPEVISEFHDSKGWEKIKEAELLIDPLDLPCDILFEYDSFNSQDFSRDDVLFYPDNEDNVFNPGILRILSHENSVKIITRVTQEKKLTFSYASWLSEDFDPLFSELLVFKEVPTSMRLLPFSSENEKKVFKPGIYTFKKFHCCFLSELSHPGESLSIHITFSFTFNSQQEMDHQYPTVAKIPVLLRIQQCLQHEHYALWEVIEFEDSYVVPANTTTTDTTSGEKSGRMATLTTEDTQRKKNDVKARTTLLLSLPDEHQLRFSKYKTARELWAAILKTFGGNEATKKTKKNLLKQQYGNFKAKGSETLEQTFTRLQVIVGQLQFMDVEIEQDDLNQKFLTSLAPEWLMHTIVWRNKSDLDTMSLDDLYNHLKVYESEVQKKSEPNSQNMAFISSAKHSSENKDGNIVCVPTASTNVPTASATIATISQDTACAYNASQSSGSQIKFEDINQIDEDDTKEMDIMKHGTSKHEGR